LTRPFESYWAFERRWGRSWTAGGAGRDGRAV